MTRNAPRRAHNGQESKGNHQIHRGIRPESPDEVKSKYPDAFSDDPGVGRR